MYIYIARQKTIQTTCILNIYTQKYKSQEAGFSCHVYPSATWTNRFRAEKRAQVTGVTFKEECETGKGNLLRRIVKVLNQLQWIHDYISLHNTHWITTSMHVIRVIPNPYRICVFNLAGFTWILLISQIWLATSFLKKRVTSFPPFNKQSPFWQRRLSMAVIIWSPVQARLTTFLFLLTNCNGKDWHERRTTQLSAWTVHYFDVPWRIQICVVVSVRISDLLNNAKWQLWVGQLITISHRNKTLLLMKH